MSPSLFLSLEYGTSYSSHILPKHKYVFSPSHLQKNTTHFLKLSTDVLVTPTLNTFFFLCPPSHALWYTGVVVTCLFPMVLWEPKIQGWFRFILQLSSAPSRKLNKWMAFHKISLIFPGERLNNELNEIAIWLNMIFMILKTLLVQIRKWISLKENNLSLCTPVMYSHK